MLLNNDNHFQTWDLLFTTIMANAVSDLLSEPILGVALANTLWHICCIIHIRRTIYLGEKRRAQKKVAGNSSYYDCCIIAGKRYRVETEKRTVLNKHIIAIKVEKVYFSYEVEYQNNIQALCYKTIMLPTKCALYFVIQYWYIYFSICLPAGLQFIIHCGITLYCQSG